MKLILVDTAFVKSAKGWTFAEDSRISRAHEKDIVVSSPPTKPYIEYY